MIQAEGSKQRDTSDGIRAEGSKLRDLRGRMLAEGSERMDISLIKLLSMGLL